MNKESKSVQAPISALLAAVALAVVTVVGLAISPLPKENLTDFFNVDRLKNSHQPVVAVMGTSLVRFALPNDHESSKLELGGAFQLMRFTRSSAKPADFEPVLPHLLQARVAIVFLQAEPFLLDFADSPQQPIARAKIILAIGSCLNNFRLAIQTIRANLLQQKTSENFLDTETEKLLLRPKKYEYDHQKTHLTVNWAGTKLSPPFEQFLDEAKDQGMSVVLLSMGRSPEAVARLGPAFKTQYSDALMEISERYKLEIWHFPQQPSEYFMDRAHLNFQGRQVFTHWFLERLKVSTSVAQ